MKNRNLFGLIAINFAVGIFNQVKSFWINIYWVRHIDPHAIFISMLSSVSAIVLVITQITMGSLSDASRSHYGRRRPFILIGCTMAGVIMCCFPFIRAIQAEITFTIVFAIINEMMLTFFLESNTQSRNALFIELTTVPERGKMNSMIALVGALGGAVIMGIYTFSLTNDDAYFYIGGLACISGAWLCFIAVEDPPKLDNPLRFIESIRKIFQKNVISQNQNYSDIHDCKCHHFFGI